MAFGFGNQPGREHASAGEMGLLRFAQDTNEDVARYRALQNQRMRDLSDLSDERRSADRLAAADFAQSAPPMGNTARGVEESGMRRARGLARLTAASDEMVNDQAFRDRAAIGRMYHNRRNRGLSPLAQAGASDVQSRMMRGAERDAKSAAKYNFMGNLAGMGLNVAAPFIGAGAKSLWGKITAPRLPDWNAAADTPSGLNIPASPDYQFDPYNIDDGERYA